MSMTRLEKIGLVLLMPAVLSFMGLVVGATGAVIWGMWTIHPALSIIVTSGIIGYCLTKGSHEIQMREAKRKEKEDASV